jgi:ribosomal protein S18 acetylase RimI-like enzyme
MRVDIQVVKKKRDLVHFIRFPADLYRDDPSWVPPLWWEERSGYSRKKNPILSQSDFVLILARSNGRVVGRNLVYIDHAFNDFNRSRIGFFGAFESENQLKIAAGLTAFAENWLRDRGMTAIRGPIHPVAENWGFLQSGFDTPPVYMSPYNPPYYNDFFEDLAFAKVKDLLVYEADVKSGYQIPERFENFFDRFFSRYPELRLRRLNLRELDRDARAIWELSNLAYSGNWGYVPLDFHVLKDMIRRLKIIVDVDAVWMVEAEDKVVAYCLGFPDLNVILKRIEGRLFPLGWLKILRGIRRVTDYRLFGLAVHPRYQRLGLDALLYIQLARTLSPKGIRLEANYILDDNYKIKNALEKLGMTRTKTYRIFEKPLAR